MEEVICGALQDTSIKSEFDVKSIHKECDINSDQSSGPFNPFLPPDPPKDDWEMEDDQELATEEVTAESKVAKINSEGSILRQRKPEGGNIENSYTVGAEKEETAYWRESRAMELEMENRRLWRQWYLKNFPSLASNWLLFLLNVTIILILLIILVYVGYALFHDTKMELQSQSNDIYRSCYSKYRENRCDGDVVPAMKELCLEWGECKKIKSQPAALTTWAVTFNSILSGSISAFFNPLSAKAIAAVILTIVVINVILTLQHNRRDPSIRQSCTNHQPYPPIFDQWPRPHYPPRYQPISPEESRTYGAPYTPSTACSCVQ